MEGGFGTGLPGILMKEENEKIRKEILMPTKINHDWNVISLYEELGVRREVLEFGRKIEAGLKERFEAIDETAEYNQLKVIHAMQKNQVSEGCFHYASGYGYNDAGRDTLEEVYASVFHTDSALVRPQITCGTHALALALGALVAPALVVVVGLRLLRLLAALGAHAPEIGRALVGMRQPLLLAP